MEDFWAWVVTLRGQMVRTVTGTQFEVVSTTRGEGITVVPMSSGIARLVRADELDRALALGLRGRDLIPRRIRERGASEYNPAYVCAILRRYYAAQAS